MKNQHSIAKIVLWFARILDAMILAFILYFVIGHLFGDSENGDGFRSISEIITFILFPICTILGLILAWKWELLGGLILFISMLGLFILRSDLIVSPYILISYIPGLLFIAYWRLNKKERKISQD